ncbi:MAG: hypothetical protein K0R15_1442 [Clostridiales bacterium]|jgi:predicted nucleotidyltransferase|nr:hypothetical protein [Clostridiales bacterium]
MELIQGIIEEFSKLPEVEGITLGGSRGSNTAMADSDYDVYIYTTEDIDISVRRLILEKYCGHMELGNAFWELEDDCNLKCGTVLEIIYRNLTNTDKELEGQVFGFNGRTGYSTCIWYNILNSKILFDKNGELERIINKYKVPYPIRLSMNIVMTNLRLLDGNIPSYSHQIEKACKRNDIVSINHRITEFLASYFDIIWALNREQHPGEKRLIELCKKKCAKLPERFEENLHKLLGGKTEHNEIMDIINEMVKNTTCLVESILGPVEKNYLY